MPLIEDKKAKQPKPFNRKSEAKKLFTSTKNKTPDELRAMLERARHEILDLREETYFQEHKLDLFRQLHGQIDIEYWRIENVV
jgi:phage terminase large subunit GpA-like protein